MDASTEKPPSGEALIEKNDSLRSRFVNGVRKLKQQMSLHEISGSLGDIGTLLPILVSMSIGGQVSLTASLIFGGLWNILSGLYFKMPICVQPMKAIAAVALTTHMSIGSVMSAGMAVSAIITLLGLFQAMSFIKKYTPDAIIKGIQLGTGISLMIKAADLVNQSSKWGGDGWDWSNNYEWAIVAFIFVFFFFLRSSFIPTALILFVVGLVLAVIKMTTTPQHEVPSIGFYYPEVVIPTWDEFKNGFLTAAIGQVPLTALNSVIALAALANELFPKIETNVTHISLSIGIMNISGCFFGSIPYCHGSGGLAGQYRFGARTGLSVIFLGTLKIILGFFFGKSLLGILKYFPTSILGVMLFISGVELGSIARKLNISEIDEQKKHMNFLTMIVTAGLLVAFKNDAVGFVGGCVVALLFFIQLWYSKYGVSLPQTEQEEIQLLET